MRSMLWAKSLSPGRFHKSLGPLRYEQQRYLVAEFEADGTLRWSHIADGCGEARDVAFVENGVVTVGFISPDCLRSPSGMGAFLAFYEARVPGGVRRSPSAPHGRQQTATRVGSAGYATSATYTQWREPHPLASCDLSGPRKIRRFWLDPLSDCLYCVYVVSRGEIQPPTRRLRVGSGRRERRNS